MLSFFNYKLKYVSSNKKVKNLDLIIINWLNVWIKSKTVWSLMCLALDTGSPFFSINQPLYSKKVAAVAATIEIKLL